MPLVFVHGVNTRRGEKPAEISVFDNRVAFFKEQFRSTAFVEQVTAEDGLAVFTPYWGDIGVKFAKNLASIPKNGVQALAATAPELLPIIETTATHLDGATLKADGLKNAPVLTVAKTRSLADAIDFLFAGASTAPLQPILLSPEKAANARAQAGPAAQAAIAYAIANPHPAWLDTITTDSAFIDQLFGAITAAPVPVVTDTTAPVINTLGFGSDLKNWLGNAANNIKTAVGHILTPVGAAVTGTTIAATRAGYMELSKYIRPAASTFIGLFFGDVFKYMENRQPIVDRVLVDIDAAIAKIRPGDDKLFLVGHSFGGIILYDILTHFRPDIKCDLWVTVGSQVALFAEIGRLAEQGAIDAAFQTGTAPRPKTTPRWVNVFDSTDLVGFATDGVFSGAWDYRFETDAFPIVSHGAYFDTPRFYQRLSQRVGQAMSATDTNGVAP